ncbi:MAG: Uma2 family endonuclease [Pegethrix bostrychoides GSE-TBD4-15B]|jgi:Uma2 family endonuclease|uniref:Uma2 family endonuclease n=1 Tax=Pegethrix bostrychoides GSE-TBD4-15B TaxID=2839662 RepID=A0A951U6Y3_9CYAN|nr:Uma2 family endonuclease [Pegethrix bostrychoides GSE-TBD4-15B]
MITSPQQFSPDEYLQMEAESPTKHEYINGEIYSMAGATDIHITLALNLAILLRNHLRGSGCQVYISDMKARIEARNCFYYPDLLVTCDPRDQQTPTYKRFPRLIAEVLSDSTEAFDRGDKFADYQTLDSLQEYILLNSRHQRLEAFRRNEAGLWVLQSYSPSQNPDSSSFELPSLQLKANLQDLYADVNLPAAPPPVDDSRR